MMSVRATARLICHVIGAQARHPAETQIERIPGRPHTGSIVVRYVRTTYDVRYIVTERCLEQPWSALIIYLVTVSN